MHQSGARSATSPRNVTGDYACCTAGVVKLASADVASSAACRSVFLSVLPNMLFKYVFFVLVRVQPVLS